MIGKVSRGRDTAGLLRYLFGPGRANEHTDPHLVATWDGQDVSDLQPPFDGRRHDVRTLAGLLDQPLAVLLRQPESTVWHCSLRTAPGDNRLIDEDWADAARTVLDHVGLAPHGDSGSCRWVAVRHADDHVHLLVTLARQDGLPARTSHDYRRVGEACREIEVLHGLRPTAPRNGTALRRPTRAEHEKAVRQGRGEASRDTLRREVRLAVAATDSPGAFLSDLQRRGLLVKLRRSNQDPSQITGYAVAWPGDRNRDGQPVWFSGSRLSNDLSLPRLQGQWGTGVQGSEGLDRPAPSRSPGAARVPDTSVSWSDALSAARTTERLLRTGQPSPGELARVAWAAGQLLLTVARTVEGSRGGLLTAAADTYGAATGRGRHGPAGMPPSGLPLLRAARTVAQRKTLTGRDHGQLVVLARETLLLLAGAHSVAHVDHSALSVAVFGRLDLPAHDESSSTPARGSITFDSGERGPRR